MNTNKDYLKTLAQQEDLNWDGNPDLDVKHECAEKKAAEEELDLDELVVKWFYD